MISGLYKFSLFLYFKGLSFCDELKIRRHYNRPGLRGGKVKFNFFFFFRKIFEYKNLFKINSNILTIK